MSIVIIQQHELANCIIDVPQSRNRLLAAVHLESSGTEVIFFFMNGPIVASFAISKHRHRSLKMNFKEFFTLNFFLCC